MAQEQPMISSLTVISYFSGPPISELSDGAMLLTNIQPAEVRVNSGGGMILAQCMQGQIQDPGDSQFDTSLRTAARAILSIPKATKASKIPLSTMIQKSEKLVHLTPTSASVSSKTTVQNTKHIATKPESCLSAILRCSCWDVLTTFSCWANEASWSSGTLMPANMLNRMIPKGSASLTPTIQIMMVRATMTIIDEAMIALVRMAEIRVSMLWFAESK
jgi:hypothetical protein